MIIWLKFPSLHNSECFGRSISSNIDQERWIWSNQNSIYADKLEKRATDFQMQMFMATTTSISK